MDDVELRRQFGEVINRLGQIAELQRRTLREQERMSQIQQTIMDAIAAADTQLKADKVVIVGQANTIATLSAQLAAERGRTADLTAQLGVKNVQLDDEVDPDSIHARLAGLNTTLADLQGTITATGTATPPAIGQNPGSQLGDIDPGFGVTIDPNTPPAPDRVVTQAPAPGPAPETTALSPSVSVIPGTTTGPGAIAGGDKAPLVDSVAASTGGSTVAIKAAVDAHVDSTDAGNTLDVAGGAAAQAAIAHGATVDTAAAIATAITEAVAPAAGAAVDPGAPVTTIAVPVPDPAKPADLPDNSVASGSASAASTIGAPPSADVAALTAAPAPAVTVTGTASGADPAAVAAVPSSPAPAAPAGSDTSSQT